MTDFTLYGDGPMATLFRLTPSNDMAREWVEENVRRDGFQPTWPELFIEHRYMQDLIDGIEAVGMTVEIT